MMVLRIGVLFLFVFKSADIDFALPSGNATLSWSFYYANVLLMKGDVNSETSEHEVALRGGESRNLLITLNYPGPDPERSTLIVRNDSGFVTEYVYETPQSVDALTPTVGTGPHFILPVPDILGPEDNAGSQKVHFALQDSESGQELQLGTIVFTLP